MSSTQKFNFGDRVIHTKRPEWGPGTITRIESGFHDGKPTQRLYIRFSGGGLRVINGAVGSLVSAEKFQRRLTGNDEVVQTPDMPVPVIPSNRREKVVSGPGGTANGSGALPSPQGGKPQPNGRAAKPRESNGWLASLERRDPEEMMLDIPEGASDPFASIWDRLNQSIMLYRFTHSARSILDWSIAQSGMEDPLAHFNRQELETLFNKWARLRDVHLFSVLQEAEKLDADRAKAILAGAPAEARQAMRRLYARR